MAFRQLGKDEEIAAGEHWISVTSGMSGFFAVEYWMNNKDIPNTVFAEPWDTGFGRYATKEEAEKEALAWAAAVELPHTIECKYPRMVGAHIAHIWEISEGVFDYSDETDNFSGGKYSSVQEAQKALDDYCYYMNLGDKNESCY